MCKGQSNDKVTRVPDGHVRILVRGNCREPGGRNPTAAAAGICPAERRP